MCPPIDANEVNAGVPVPPTAGESAVSNGTGGWQYVGLTQGADLTDANQALNVSQGNVRYLRPGVLTGNRVDSLANTGAVDSSIIAILREDTSAFTLTLNNIDATPLFVLPASLKTGVVIRYSATLNLYELASSFAITSTP